MSFLFRNQQEKLNARKSSKVFLISFDNKGIALSVQFLKRELSYFDIETEILVIAKLDFAVIQVEDLRNQGRILAANFPKLIGFSIMSEDMTYANEVIKGIRSVDSQVVIIAGGIHPSINPAQTLAYLGIDAVMIGIGHNELIDFIIRKGIERPLNWFTGGETPRNIKYNYKVNDTKGILGPQNINIIRNNSIRKITRAEHAQMSHWNLDHYHTIATIGCPYSCSYCNNYHSKNIKNLGIEEMIYQLKDAIGQHDYIHSVIFHDDAFFMGNIKLIQDFSEMFKDSRDVGFIVRLMPKYINDDLISRLKQAGLNLVKIGLQGSSRMNKSIYKRNENKESFIKAIKILKKYDVKYEVDVIIDNPFEKKSDLYEIAQTLNELPKPFRTHVYDLKAYPGTEIEKQLREKNFLKDDIPYSFVPKINYKTEKWFRMIFELIPWMTKKEIETYLYSGPEIESYKCLVNFYCQELPLLYETWINKLHARVPKQKTSINK